MPKDFTKYYLERKILKSFLLLIKLLLTVLQQLLGIFSITERKNVQKFSEAEESENDKPESTQFSYCISCAKKKNQEYRHPFAYRKRRIQTHNSALEEPQVHESEFESD